MIFFGVDAVTNAGLHLFLNGFYWDAFGELIDIALKDKHPEVHSIIKSESALAFNYYKFDELNKQEFEIAISAIRTEISKWVTLNVWQERAKSVWQGDCEPWILRDKRLSIEY